MKIDYLDGPRLRNAVVAGAHAVIERQEFLNKINVFPVPDGDTGTNLALTMRAVSDAALNAQTRELAPLAAGLAEAALMGARGNSGSIMAQFFLGLASGFEGLERAGVRECTSACAKAAAFAREAVSAPREGTILTVMGDWAGHLAANGGAASLDALFQASLAAARISLERTPELLPALKRAKVVDAGAQGFVNLLEGIADYLENGAVRRFLPEGDSAPPAAAEVTENPEGIAFRFCTEGFIRGAGIDAARIRAEAGALGDSMTCVGGGASLRVHIHTNEPERLFELLQRHGELISSKREDMRAQHSAAHGKAGRAKVGLIMDSSCALPSEYVIRHKIHVVPVSVTFGDKTYLDWVNITLEGFYRLLAESPHHPKTSQPPPGEFLKTYRLAARFHKRSLALIVTGGLSGTYQSALKAAKMAEGAGIEVLDSRNVSATHGLLMMVAVEAAEAGCPIEEVRRRVELARERVWSFTSVETLEYAVRGGRISRRTKIVADFLGLLPVITITPEGKLATAARSFGRGRNLPKTLALVKERARRLAKPRFMVCHAASPERAQACADELQKEFGAGEIPVLPIPPSLGSHVGPGAVNIGVLGFLKGEESF